MKGKLKYLIPAIIILGLVFPKPASAVIFTGFFDYFEAALSGVEEFAGPIAKFLLYIFFYYVAGLGTLLISSSLLQMIIENPDWLSVSATNNPLVFSGWSFIAGLANMFLILLFVFIALATILKIETFAAKKLLPRLLFVAILVNFSLVFVGIPVDISNIFYRSIVSGSKGLVPDIFVALVGSTEGVIANIVGQIVLLVVLFIIPIVSPFAQLGLVIAIVSTNFIGMILIWLVQGMMCFLMSGILFTYVFLFIARNYIIQFLAMLAPVAFICMVLPKTKKFWDDWLGMLVEWNTFGVVTLLFLIIGLRSLDTVMPSGVTSIDISSFHPSALLFWQNIPAFVTYYLFLFVYLTSLLYFSRKYTPELGGFLIQQAKSMGTVIMQQGMKLLSAAKPAAQRAGRWAGKKAGGRIRKGGERRRISGTKKLKKIEEKKEKGDISRAGAWLRRRGRKFQIAVATRGEQIGRRMTVGAEESETRTIEEAKSKTKGKTKGRQSFELQNAIANKYWNRALGAAEAMMEDKNLSEAEAKGLFGDKEYKTLVEKGKEVGRKDIVRYDLGRAAQIMEPEKWEKAEGLEKKAKRLEETGEKGEAEKARKEASEIKRETMGELFDKVIDPNKMDQVSEKSFENEDFVKTFVDRAKGNHAAGVSLHHSRETLNRIQDEINERGVIKTIKDNPIFAKWLGTNSAQKAGLNLPQDLNKDDTNYIQEKYSNEMKKEGQTEDQYYDKNFKQVVRDAIPVTRDITKEEREEEKDKELRDIKDDPQKLFDTYYAKETPKRVKGYIKGYLSDKKITLPSETMVKMMGKKKERLKEKLKKDVGEEKGEEILNRAIGSWKEDLSKGRGGLGLTLKHISGVKEEIRKEEKKEAVEKMAAVTRPPTEIPLEEEFREEFEEKRKLKTKEMLDEIIDKAAKEEGKKAREAELRGEYPSPPTRFDMEKTYREQAEKRLPEELKSIEEFTENKLKEKFKEIRETKIRELIPEIVNEKRGKGLPIPPEKERGKIYRKQAIVRLPKDLENMESFKKGFRIRMTFEKERENRIKKTIDDIIKKEGVVVSPRVYRKEAIRGLPEELKNIEEYKKKPERIKKIEQEVTYKEIETMRRAKEEGEEKKKLEKEERKIRKEEEIKEKRGEIKKRYDLEKKRVRIKKEAQKRLGEIFKEQEKKVRSNIDKIHKNFERVRKAIKNIEKVGEKRTVEALGALKKSIKEAERFEKETKKETKRLKKKAEQLREEQKALILEKNLESLKESIREAEEFEKSVKIDELRERIRIRKERKESRNE